MGVLLLLLTNRHTPPHKLSQHACFGCPRNNLGLRQCFRSSCLQWICRIWIPRICTCRICCTSCGRGESCRSCSIHPPCCSICLCASCCSICTPCSSIHSNICFPISLPG